MKRKKKHNIDTIERPVQSGIHDIYKSGLSRNIWTAVHVGYLHSNDDRRHKSRCIYYDKSDRSCHCGKTISKRERRCDIMLCITCGAAAEKGYTTDVTDLGNCLVIIRNVPCYKCTECNEIMYTGDVVQQIEKIVNIAKQCFQEISIIDYNNYKQVA